MINQYPAWKYVTVLVLLVVSLIYSLPNIYGKRLSVVITPRAENIKITEEYTQEVKKLLGEKKLKFTDVESNSARLVIAFGSKIDQGDAATLLEQTYFQQYIVVRNLEPNTPAWLQFFNAKPMHLGLDLQGGLHALMDVELDEAVRRFLERTRKDIQKQLKDKGILASTTEVSNGLRIRLRDEKLRNRAEQLMKEKFSDYFSLTHTQKNEFFFLDATMLPDRSMKVKDDAMEKNIQALRRRINELGVTEPVIVRHGDARILIQLPGVQDPNKLWDVINKEVSLQVHGVAEENNSFDFSANATPPVNTIIHKDKHGKPTLLKRDPIFSGERVTNATKGFSSRKGDNTPAVHVNLDTEGANANHEYTRYHVGKPMAILFVDTRPSYEEKDGIKIRVNRKVYEIINVATIQSDLGAQFEITGLSEREAETLSLFLRSGSMAAPITPADVRTVSATLGEENVAQGMNSVFIGMLTVVIFMIIYYRAFGLIANFGLIFNMFMLVALLSLLQATLTLPGIAGIVLTLGMAVDANVLINERIREELRLGNSPQASIHAGYERAFTTIADSNLTTLIGGVVLFSVGTGAVKGFAVVLCLGILTSMFTAVMGTRAVVNLVYGQRTLQKISI